MALLLIGVLVSLCGCIQPQKSPVVEETVLSKEWKPDGVVGPGEYARSMVLRGLSSTGYSGGTLQVSWKNDAQYLYVALNGSTRGWISLGFEPSEWMKDADIIMGSVQGGRAILLDEYCTGNYGPHENDTALGGSYDLLEAGGSSSDRGTVIELKRKMNTGDRFDKSFVPGQTVSFIWALANSASSDVKHDVAKGEGMLELQGGGPVSGSFPALTGSEREGLGFIREEEKVSRDLYLLFFSRTSLDIFQNTARSEQDHMDAVLVLLERFGLEDPGREPAGRFVNQSLQEIYDRLARAPASDSLTAAANYEEISIIDLQSQIALTGTDEIKATYLGLLAGSQKHLRSYVNALRERGLEYSPAYLEPEQFRKIVQPS